MRNSAIISGTRSPLSSSRGQNFSVSSMGSPTRSGFSSSKSANMSSFSTALHQIKCQQSGHQNKSIQWVCMAKDCKLDSRIVCPICYASTHSIHQKQMIKVQEIFDNIDDQNISNWPLEEHGKQVKEYVNTENQYIQGLFSELDTFFEILQDQLFKKLESLKKGFISDINTFHTRGEGKEKLKFLESLKKMYEDAYNFTDLQDLIKKFFQREVTYDTFYTGINYYLGDKEKIASQKKLYNFFVKNMQNSQITDNTIVQAKIDKESLRNIQKQIMDGLNRFKSCISVAQVQVISQDELPFTPTLGLKLNGIGDNIKEQQNWGIQYQEILNYMNQQTQQLTEKDCLMYKRELYADNSKYEGFLLNGQRHLLGARYYADGNIYFGQWQRGVKQGNGIMHFTKGSLYQGEWNNDKKQGQAIEIYPNNTRYEGQFEDGYKHGFGKFIYNDGKVFEGIYIQDKRNGVGKIISKNNQVEQVYFVMGEKVTEEKYEQYLQQGGYTTMSQMKNQIQDSNSYHDSSQSCNTQTFNQNNQNS